RRNSDGAEVYGLNMNFDFQISNFKIDMGGTWQSSRYTGQGMEWDEGKFENRMERMPDLYGYLSATYNPSKRLSLMATGTFTGPMLVYHSVEHEEGAKHSHATEVEQVITPSFFDLTLKATYSIPLGARSTLEVNGGVQNVFNSFQRDFDSGPDRDASYIYGPTLPRTLFLGARLAI
ncbi:MAG: TonB-dependent receptor, partial [Bacteroidales bacterium]|nr:TonB-dependent receptor [Bacteroidales bacterium]